MSKLELLGTSLVLVRVNSWIVLLFDVIADPNPTPDSSLSGVGQDFACCSLTTLDCTMDCTEVAQACGLTGEE